MRTSGKTNNTPGWPNLQRTGPGVGGGGTYKKRNQRALSPNPQPCALGRSSLRIFGSTCPHVLKMDFPAIF